MPDQTELDYTKWKNFIAAQNDPKYNSQIDCSDDSEVEEELRIERQMEDEVKAVRELDTTELSGEPIVWMNSYYDPWLTGSMQDLRATPSPVRPQLSGQDLPVNPAPVSASVLRKRRSKVQSTCGDVKCNMV